MEAKQLNIHADLIKACLQNDTVAQYKLYELYAKAMFHVALRICNGREQAEDVLQDAFVSAFKNLKSYKGTASFGAWLKRIVVNTALNTIKSERLTFEELTEYNQEGISEEKGLLEDELSVEQIKNAIKELPNGYRVVISLYLFEGYDHKEIAEILQVSESTSKSQYNRAKQKLRELLRGTQLHQDYGR